MAFCQTVFNGFTSRLQRTACFVRNLEQGCSSKFNSRSQIIRPLIKCNIETPCSKIGVVGLGNVGIAVTAALLFGKITNEIGVVDVGDDKLQAEALDFRQMSMFLNHAKIEATTTYDALSGSKICIITAGVRPNPGETRLTILGKNAVLLKKIVSEVMKYASDTIYILASNPVDVMTYLTARITGCPLEKVIGSGTNLDTARLRYLMSQKFNVAIDSCEGWVLGEHGLSSVVAWSTCKVGGAFISDINPNMGMEGDSENWVELHNILKYYGPNINKLKGYTNWGVALSVCSICNAIINNTKEIHAVTVPAKGFHGITDNVYLSLPAVIGGNGILEIIELPLTETECVNLQNSGKFLFKHQEELKL